MKTLTLLFTLTTFASFATVRTVSNDGTRPAQYNGTSSFQNALDAAVHGDTIFVYGSATSYGNVTVRRRVVLIGAGFNTNNQFGFSTVADDIYLFRDNGLNDASGTVITGFDLKGIGITCASLIISNIKIFRNFIMRGISNGNAVGASGFSYSGIVLYPICIFPTNNQYSDNWTIYNNMVGYIAGGSNSLTSPGQTNIIIQNNIIGVDISGFVKPSVVIDHNIFLNEINLVGVCNAVITNNIFSRTNNNIIYPGDGSWPVIATLNVFNKNISTVNTIGPIAPTDSFLANNNTGADFLIGDPQFENVPNLNTYNATYNYRIKSSSPGHNAGTDGTDIGIYGGLYPFPSGGAPGSGFDTSPAPTIPQLTEMNIQNASLLPTQQLKVNVKGKLSN